MRVRALTGRVAAVAGLAFALVAAAPAAPRAPVQAHPQADRYAEGQVWEYRTRAGDEGSLLKIQKIETPPEFAKQGPVYHISIIGLHVLTPTAAANELRHAPVSRATLDASVTRLSERRADFPGIEEGIAEWRQAKGGVFTIPVAQIVGALESALRSVPQRQ